jgi:dTDP-4-amino-4,6-dideoxygalactose transaminase
MSLPWQPRYQTVYTNSGTAALAIAVMVAQSKKPGETQPEVILPAYGCPDLLAAVYAAGAAPVLVDLLPGLPFMDPAQVRKALSERTVAVIAPGLSGLPERLDSLSELCRPAGILLIEDSAQCFPPQCVGNPLADLVVLSFGRGKPVNLMGGGAILIHEDLQPETDWVIEQFKRDPLQITVKWLLKRWFFNALLSPVAYFWLERIPVLRVGQTWFKALTDIRTLDMPEALLNAGLKAFGQRPLVHNDYVERLAFLKAGGWRCLFEESPDVGESPILRWPLLAPDKRSRDYALVELNAAGIGASALYERPLPEIEGVPSGLLGVYPNATFFADRFMTLPAHEGLGSQHVDTIEQVMKRLAKRQPPAEDDLIDVN